MHKYEQESKKTGKQTAYAWVMDDTEEERYRSAVYWQLVSFAHV